jgi:DNA-binding IclR family transcriptional regulator
VATKKTVSATAGRKTGRAAAAAETVSDSPLMVNSVYKAFRVLKAFDHAEPRLTLTQIATKLQVDKSTAQRFVHTLEALGYLLKDPVTKTLSLSVRVLDLANIYLTTSPFITTAIPYLMHLNQETGETVNLTVLDGADVVFVSRLVGNHLLSTGVSLGTRLPAYCSAAGIAILSALDEAAVRRILQASELKAYTPHTICEPARIRERLRSTRAKGYTVGVSEYFLNDISIGAPILDRRGQPAGAVSLAVSLDRMTPKEAEAAFGQRVLAAARSVVI